MEKVLNTDERVVKYGEISDISCCTSVQGVLLLGQLNSVVENLVAFPIAGS